MSFSHNKALISRSMRAWQSPTPAVLAEIFHVDLIYEDVPLAKVMRGLAAFELFFMENKQAFPDIEMKLIDAVADEALGGAEWTLSGTYMVDLDGLGAATGRRFDIRGASIFRFADSRIISVADYFDGPSFTSQLGI